MCAGRRARREGGREGGEVKLGERRKRGRGEISKDRGDEI